MNIIQEGWKLQVCWWFRNPMFHFEWVQFYSNFCDVQYCTDKGSKKYSSESVAQCFLFWKNDLTYSYYYYAHNCKISQIREFILINYKYINISWFFMVLLHK